VVPPGQAQPPLTQVVPEGHAFAHAPQFELSLAVFTQRVPQRVVPVGHTQRPAVQT
jgi:hypothetical protein